jgi:hypothetical protein
MPYFAPNLPEFHYLRHLILPVWDWNSPPSKKDLSLLLAHINRKTGKADGWFYDSILPMVTHAPSGNALLADINRGTTRSGGGDFYAIPHPNPTHKKDWEEVLEGCFAPEGPLHLIDNLVPELSRQIGKTPDHPINIILTIPYPSALMSMFGKLKENGAILNFSVTAQNLMKASEQRLEACCWYVDKALQKWAEAGFKDIHFLGFYWLHETLRYSWDIDDHWVIKELRKHIRRRKCRFIWIPFYSTYNLRILKDYQDIYFDCAILQPGHIFYTYVKDVKEAALEAKNLGAGFELEYYYQLPGWLGVGEEKYQRFRNYLNGGVRYGYMKEAVCGHFIGRNSIPEMFHSDDPRERETLDDLYHFVKGDYQIKEG